jgi:hypothetical protein
MQVLSGGIFQVTGVLVFALMLRGCEKRRVDTLMYDLCKQDRGARIYEKV